MVDEFHGFQPFGLYSLSSSYDVVVVVWEVGDCGEIEIG